MIPTNLFLGESAKSAKISYNLNGDYNNSRSSWLQTYSNTNPQAVHTEKHLQNKANQSKLTELLTTQIPPEPATQTNQLSETTIQRYLEEFLEEIKFHETLDTLISSTNEHCIELEFGHGGIANREGWPETLISNQQTLDPTFLENTMPAQPIPSSVVAAHTDEVLNTPLIGKSLV